MSEGSNGPRSEEEERRIRRRQAENRVVMTAALQAGRKRMPGKPEPAGPQMITAIVVIVVIVATLALAIRYG